LAGIEAYVVLNSQGLAFPVWKGAPTFHVTKIALDDESAAPTDGAARSARRLEFYAPGL
jgi:hypothetical protein